jgi:NitT/TauT family transport system substrate-binding protein
MALVICLVLAVTGCQKTEPVEKVTQITIGTLKGPSGVSLLKMMDTPDLLGADIPVTYAVEAQPDILTTKLLAGELDFATIPTNTAAILKNKGADYRIVAMNTWGVLYIVGTDAAIQSIPDLKGKALSSVGQGTTPDLVLNYLLKQGGLVSQTDVTIDYSLPHQELATALIAGKVNLAMLPEPFVTMALMQNKDLKLLIDLQKEWSAVAPTGGQLPQTCFVAKGSLIDSHPEVIAQVLKAYNDSLAYANENPIETGALAEKLALFPKGKIIEMAIPRLMLDSKSMKESKPLIQAYYDILLTASPEAIGGKLPDESLYYLP